MEHKLKKGIYNEVLEELFGLKDISEIEMALGGFWCKNFSFVSSGKKFFFKQYSHKSESRVMAIKHAEHFFSEHQIPIILPIPNKHDAAAFEFEGQFYSLFPFIESMQTPPPELTPQHLASMGKMQGQLHRIGALAKRSEYPIVGSWNTKDFFRVVNDIRHQVSIDDVTTKGQKLAFENIERRMSFLEKDQRNRNSFGLKNETLLHGDFIYTNVFFDGRGLVSHVYDVERCGFGPRAYDLVRSIFISCFDDGWDEKNCEFARVYLKAYQCESAIEKHVFREALEMYRMHFMHMSWLEIKILLEGSRDHEHLIEGTHVRLKNFLNRDLDEIVETIFVC